MYFECSDAATADTAETLALVSDGRCQGERRVTPCDVAGVTSSLDDSTGLQSVYDKTVSSVNGFIIAECWC